MSLVWLVAVKGPLPLSPLAVSGLSDVTMPSPVRLTLSLTAYSAPTPAVGP